MKDKVIYLLLIASIALNVILGIRLYSNTPQAPTPTAHNPVAEGQVEPMTDDIYFIGNSILKPAKLDVLLNNPRISNNAVNGITSTDAVMMSNQLIPAKPKKVFIMLGINDIKSKTPMNITIRNIGHFAYTIKRYSPKTQIYILSVLPVNEQMNKYGIKNNQVRKLNHIIKDFCQRFNFEYIDLYNVLLDGSTKNLDAKFTTDGLHINQDAYIELVKPLQQYTK